MKKTILILAALTLAACASKDLQTTEAVRQAVVDDVRGRAARTGLNPDAMEVAVLSVSFASDQAHANVAFTPKGMPQGSGMSMDYTLARQGNKWVVTNRQMSGPTPHGTAAPGAAEPGAVQPGAVQPGPIPPGATLPPGHPSVGTNR